MSQGLSFYEYTKKVLAEFNQALALTPNSYVFFEEGIEYFAHFKTQKRQTHERSEHRGPAQ